jgi:hypothetical protein
MAGIRAGEATAEAVAGELAITGCRVRQLYRRYLEACSTGEEQSWAPGTSGGQHGKQIPEDVQALWRKLLTARPAASYSFAASEAHRRYAYQIDRATVRRWARQNGVSHAPGRARAKDPLRRWQCGKIGALWQLDASAHPWFGRSHDRFPMLNMVDDCSRVITGSRFYPRECLLAYLDFLPRAFEAYGLPVALYVDYHSFFFSQIPDNLTYLGEALRFYGIHLKYAPTPQAKGKIERHHQFWQNRLPSYFAAESIHELDAANPHLDRLRLHHNQQEIHREIRMTPDAAWTLAKREKRSALRPCPKEAWWRYIWSIRSRIRVDLDGTVPVDTIRLPISARPFSYVQRCQHPDGSYTFLAYEPGTGGRPIVLLRYEGAGPQWKV